MSSVSSSAEVKWPWSRSDASKATTNSMPRSHIGKKKETNKASATPVQNTWLPVNDTGTGSAGLQLSE